MANPHKKAIVITIVIALLMSAYFVAYFGFLISLLDGFIRYALGVIPLVLLAVMAAVSIERINEIKKGENDDLSQY